MQIAYYKTYLLSSDYGFGARTRLPRREVAGQLSKRAGLPNLINPETGSERGVSPHRLRDAFSVHAMKLDNSGDGLRLLQEHLGHASFNTTAKYRKIAGDEQRKWYDRLWDKSA
ncbi:Tyrosine recombinase XerC [subsurface metagenome]